MRRSLAVPLVIIASSAFVSANASAQNSTPPTRHANEAEFIKYTEGYRFIGLFTSKDGHTITDFVYGSNDKIREIFYDLTSGDNLNIGQEEEISNNSRVRNQFIASKGLTKFPTYQMISISKDITIDQIYADSAFCKWPYSRFVRLRFSTGSTKLLGFYRLRESHNSERYVRHCEVDSGTINLTPRFYDISFQFASIDSSSFLAVGLDAPYFVKIKVDGSIVSTLGIDSVIPVQEEEISIFRSKSDRNSRKCQYVFMSSTENLIASSAKSKLSEDIHDVPQRPSAECNL